MHASLWRSCGVISVSCQYITQPQETRGKETGRQWLLRMLKLRQSPFLMLQLRNMLITTWSTELVLLAMTFRKFKLLGAGNATRKPQFHWWPSEDSIKCTIYVQFGVIMNLWRLTDCILITFIYFITSVIKCNSLPNTCISCISFQHYHHYNLIQLENTINSIIESK